MFAVDRSGRPRADDILSYAEAAALAGKGEMTVRRWVKRGWLRSYARTRGRIEGRGIRRGDLERFLREGRPSETVD